MSTTLNDISAADFLGLVQSGDIDLNDFIDTSEGSEKVASELSEYSDDELLQLLETLEESDSSELEKEAGEFDLNELSVEEFITVAAHLEEEMEKEAMLTPAQKKLPPDIQEAIAKKKQKEMNKKASTNYQETDMNLNELSPEQIVDLAYELQDEMEKEASGIDLNELSIEEFIDFAAHLEDDMEKEAKAGVGSTIMHHLREAGGRQMMRGARGYAANRRFKDLKGASGENAKKLMGMARKEALIGGGKAAALYGAPVAGGAYAYKKSKRRR